MNNTVDSAGYMWHKWWSPQLLICLWYNGLLFGWSRASSHYVGQLDIQCGLKKPDPFYIFK